MEKEKHRKAFVVFQPSGCRGFVDYGISIMEASRHLGADIESLCGEIRICGKCKVKIEEGFFAKYNITSERGNVSPWVEEEGKFVSESAKAEGFRLSCCGKVEGDLLVFVPEESRAGKQIVSKEARRIPITVNPAVKKYCVELAPPQKTDASSDFERLSAEMDKLFGLRDLKIDIHALRELPDTIRKGNWKVTVSVWCGKEIIRVTAGTNDSCYGIAFDVGTTTVAAYLCDLKSGEVIDTVSRMNPQCRYGEDVMSRICYQMTIEDGLAKMSDSIIEAVNSMIAEFERNFRRHTKEKGEQEKDGGGAYEKGKNIKAFDIEDITLVGNTAMLHIFLMLNPEHMGVAPFPPVIKQGMDIKARDLGVLINPSAYIHFLPCEAGYVGADNVGVLLAEEPYNTDEVQLLIDIGTNGELVLSDGPRMFSSSCATGPALEGAQLRFGMRAAPGAIERVRIDEATHEVDYKVVGRDAWLSYSLPENMSAKGICGSGILDLIAEFFRCGIIEKSGAFNKKQISNRFRRNENLQQYEFVVAWSKETSIGMDVVITQADIRQIQLAKGALHCGCKLMMERMGLSKVDKVKIAGAFGTHVDPAKALIIGLFPDCELEQIVSIGNAAGDGARIALLNRAKRKEAEEIARRTTYIELTEAANFQKEFAMAMQFPHMSDPFPNARKLMPEETDWKGAEQ